MVFSSVNSSCFYLRSRQTPDEYTLRLNPPSIATDTIQRLGGVGVTVLQPPDALYDTGSGILIPSTVTAEKLLGGVPGVQARSARNSAAGLHCGDCSSSLAAFNTWIAPCR